MGIQDQCVSLEQAKRLDELGVGADSGRSAFYWVCDVPAPFGIRFKDNFCPHEDGVDYYRAWNVAELGVMLPRDHQWSFRTKMSGNYQWGCAVCEKILSGDGYDAGAMEHGPTEAQARAALLIHLLEAGQITAADVNARLAK